MLTEDYVRLALYQVNWFFLVYETPKLMTSSLEYRGRIIGLREGGFSYHSIGACVSDASLEAVDRRAPNNSKNWQWMTEGDVSTRRSTPAPHGGE
ncbi:hypothetical protein TNCV_1853501 [Trichonephila clavipes]|nr:hypothetical protein TNCV_1853501 [Trichonephila clavipes]